LWDALEGLGEHRRGDKKKKKKELVMFVFVFVCLFFVFVTKTSFSLTQGLLVTFEVLQGSRRVSLSQTQFNFFFFVLLPCIIVSMSF